MTQPLAGRHAREFLACPYPLSGHPMRIALNVTGILFVLMGGVWILQGINILPGSFMTGQTKWAVYGGILLVAGIVLLIAGKRRHLS